MTATPYYKFGLHKYVATPSGFMPENDYAPILANRILDRPSADPDDDLAILARQFLRLYEAQKAMRDGRKDSK